MLATFCWCAPSEARTPPANVALHYETSFGCPDAAFFAREVSARTPQVVFHSDRAPDHRFDVRLRGAPGAYSGVLWMIDASGASSVRTFRAERCADVVVALALVAALAVDPNASTVPGAVSVQSLAMTGLTPQPEKPGAPWIWSVGLVGDVMTGVTPVWLIALGGFVNVERDSPGFAPSFRLSPYYAQTGLTGPSTDSANFDLLAVRAEGCPLPFALSKTARLLPCIGLDVGLLHAYGVDVAQSTERNRLWLSLLLDARLQLDLNDELFLEASGGPAFPLTWHKFVFENPDEVIHDVPWLSARAGLAVGTRFP